MLSILAASITSLATKANADTPTPLISIHCLSEMNLLTLNVFSEWNLCTGGQNCTALENQGAYSAEVFLQRFSKVPFICKMAGGAEVDVVVNSFGRNSIGLAVYELTVTSNAKKLYTFKPDVKGFSDSLNLVVDGSLNQPLLMACLMKSQSIISLPDTVTCRKSGQGTEETTLSGGG